MSIAIPGELTAAVAGSGNILVLTGAGISAESGVGTFRDKQTGLWAKYRPQDLATPEAFQRNPQRVWQWYQWRRRVVSQVEPNAGHYALAELEQRTSGFTLVTQNVDGLHQRGGSRRMVELHGNLFSNICSITGEPLESIGLDIEEPPASGKHPRGLARPGVVWFGEALPRSALNQALQAAQQCDFCFSIGTSSMVEPAASLPLMAKSAGAKLAELNIEDTPLSSYADWLIRAPAAQALPLLLTQLSREPHNNA